MKSTIHPMTKQIRPRVFAALPLPFTKDIAAIKITVGLCSKTRMERRGPQKVMP
jgi:hypothetical protein